jgi:hypothetical protein
VLATRPGHVERRTDGFAIVTWYVYKSTMFALATGWAILRCRLEVGDGSPRLKLTYAASRLEPTSAKKIADELLAEFASRRLRGSADEFGQGGNAWLIRNREPAAEVVPERDAQVFASPRKASVQSRPRSLRVPLQHALIDLLKMLDPEYLRFPRERRAKA